MDYEQKYKEALERANELLYVSDKESLQRKTIESIFPEFKESEDETIRKDILAFIKNNAVGEHNWHKWLAWLEKQGEQENKINFTFDDELALQCCMETVKKVQEDKELYEQLQSLHDRLHDAYWLKKQGKQKLVEKYNITGIGSKNAQGKLGEMIKEMKSADKVEPKFKVGEWVVLSTSDGEKVVQIDSIEYFKSGEPIYITSEGRWFGNGTKARLLTDKDMETISIPESKVIAEQKPADKVEPKFHEGEWIIRSAEGFKHNTYLVKEVKDYYACEDLKGRRVTFTLNDVHKNFKLWDITKDAKDGDVLAIESRNDYPSPFIAIYKERGLDYFNSYCFVGFDEKFYTGETGHDVKGIHPATKEQRDTLEKAMADAGWEFDFEKKELKKIEQKPAWSEEDEEMRLDAIKYLELFDAQGIHGNKTVPCINWLKSLRPQKQWKPSDEQLKQLGKYCIDNTALTSLYEYLKQL